MRTSILFLLCAFIIPGAVLSKDLFYSGTLMVAFIIIQFLMIIGFLASKDQGFDEWHTFWAVIAGTFYMLTLLISGRSLILEAIGVLLLLLYLASAVAFIFKRQIEGVLDTARPERAREGKESKVQSELSPEEVEQFRRKDELRTLADSPIPEAPISQKHLDEYDDFKKPKINAASEEEDIEWVEGDFLREYRARDDNEGYYEIKAETEYEGQTDSEGYIELYPDDKLKREEEQRRKGRGLSINLPKVEVVELKEAPRIDIEKLRASAHALDESVGKIKDRIRLIAEKAILEGAQKKIDESVRNQRKKSLLTEKKALEDAAKKLGKAVLDAKRKKDVKDEKVFASQTGTKYHHDEKCMSLKRVRKKDVVTFKDSKEARKQGLKSCGLCKKH